MPIKDYAPANPIEAAIGHAMWMWSTAHPDQPVPSIDFLMNRTALPRAVIEREIRRVADDMKKGA